MGFLVAIAFGLFYKPISNSQLVQGGLSLKKTFWLYAVIIGGGIYGVALWNLFETIGDPDGDVKGALTLGIFVTGYYSLFVFLAVWRSSKQANFMWKWGARYVSLFFLSGVISAVMYSMWYVAATAITVFLIAKAAKGNQRNTSTNAVQPRKS